MLQLAQVMRKSLELAATWAGAVPTTMANHRSVAMPDVSRPLEPGDELKLQAVLATMRLDYDLVPLLDAGPDAPPVPVKRPSYLMWELRDDRRIRLSEVDPFLYAALERLQEGPQPVAALMVDWAARTEEFDYHQLMHVLNEARTLRIVETV
jgi:hypothetical protein